MRSKNVSIAILLLGLALAGVGFCAQKSPSKPELYEPTRQRIDRLGRMHAGAESLVATNRLSEAAQAYQDIILFEPDDESAYTSLGYVLLTMGHYKKAHEAFNNALSINPENESALIGIQKILDPDGLDGMITPDQTEGLSPMPQDPEAPSKLIGVQSS